MNGEYIVSEINGEKITVTPFSSGMSERGKIVVSHISVINPSKFQVNAGTVVTIGFSGKMKKFQGIFAAVFPVLLAFAGYFIFPVFIKLFHKDISEFSDIWRFLFVLFFFGVGFSMDIIKSRTSHTILRPRITSIVKKDE